MRCASHAGAPSTAPRALRKRCTAVCMSCSEGRLSTLPYMNTDSSTSATPTRKKPLGHCAAQGVAAASRACEVRGGEECACEHPRARPA